MSRRARAAAAGAQLLALIVVAASLGPATAGAKAATTTPVAPPAPPVTTPTAPPTPTTPASPAAPAAVSPVAPVTIPPPNPVPRHLRRPIKTVSMRAGGAYQSIAPAAAVVFDVGSGEVLFSLEPDRRLPIASLTKMMTALIVAQRDSPDEQLMVSRKAASVPGSRIGVLPQGKLVPLGPVFAGMMLVSGNDAAEALAEHDAGTEAAFVERMNNRAQGMGLTCTHFSSPHGLQDAGNYSCARDLAVLARADLADPWIREIAARKRASFPFPIEGGRLEVANNDYFIQRGLPQIPGAVVTGLKTGYTDPAGRCYVVTARVGGRELGVVLLHSPDPFAQVPLLLGHAFSRSG
jgi:serine-type D-Ala-D-Ala carboxypeptidase (penicillin-binding protein 5/6)